MIASIEAAKGVVVLAAGLGLFELMHRDVQDAAERLVRNMHLNPASHYPRVFLEVMARLDKPDLRLLALGALAYALVRFVEAFGLWRARRWAEWFGALSGSVYLPLEVFKLFELLTWPRVTVLITNIVVVAYLASILMRASAGPPKATAA
ncbi:MAG TPA: DUF2127 domain-containing protein [Opitutaceae bacterium]|nr:DUF2127 domain-containing protein [Opitutaceae bacterium]